MDKLYKLKEVMQILGVSKTTLYQWKNKGKIKMIKISDKQTRITGKELERIMKGE